MNYSFLISLKKAVRNSVLFAIPVLLQFLPSDVLNLTIGGILVIVYDIVKRKTALSSVLP